MHYLINCYKYLTYNLDTTSQFTVLHAYISSEIFFLIQKMGRSQKNVIIIITSQLGLRHVISAGRLGHITDSVLSAQVTTIKSCKKNWTAYRFIPVLSE